MVDEQSMKYGIYFSTRVASWSYPLIPTQYVIYFPKGEKYVSLLKDAETVEAQAHLQAERQRLRELVKQQIQEQAVVTEADEGRGLMQSSKASAK